MPRPIEEIIKKEAIRLRTEEYLSLREIRQMLGISKSTLSVLLRDFPLKPEEELLKIKEAREIARASCILRNAKVEADSVRQLQPIPAMQPFYKGFIAEFYVKYRLLREGIHFLSPEYPLIHCDLVVAGKSHKHYNVEIKSCTRGCDVNVNRTVYVRGNSRDSVNYKDVSGIDLFILVSLENENMFIVPYGILADKAQVCLSSKGSLWKFRDRFDLLE